MIVPLQKEAGFCSIFTIAQDLTKMLVYTKTDESDVGNIKPRAPRAENAVV
jgi:hypothetical protein